MSRELNLVPQIESNEKGSVKSNKALLQILLLVVVFVGGSFGYVFGKEYILNKKVTDLKNELALSNEKLKQKDDLDKQIAVTKQQIQKAEELKLLTDIDTDKLIKDLYSLVEIDGIVVDSINYNAGNESSISISGRSGSNTAIQKMWANLRESESFVDSHVNNSSGEGELIFSLDIKLKGGSVDENQN